MRDLASCFSDYSVQISETSCSNYSPNSCISPNLTPSVQNAVTSLYKATLSNQKQIPVTLTWSRSSVSQSLTIALGDGQSTAVKLTTNSRIFRKLKGAKTLESHGSKIEIFYDLSDARYESGAEPIDGYYVFIAIDSALSPILGGGGSAPEVYLRKLKSGAKMAKFALVSRQEHLSGNAMYSTKAKFRDGGAAHDVVIQCGGGGDGEGMKQHPVLSVCVDRKTVIRVKRLQWNFRGNQTIFLDGLLVDLMWDVYDWFSGSGSGSGPGCAVFMFRTRSGMDSRLWLEEKMVKKDEDKHEFSFMIYACKNL
ncbi:hypothetical protein SASPL_122157 [Salvia splendens]|uniref:Uncharacterized protein n=1 Tax=Salvia splendens TaxID=180675 RepID=A0A8X8XMU5_SALSN|nr:uncharacterized protein LOC121744629 [Salvia splendens]KAG6414783.1 hypothetical protein SASPL_122157 [Salvia splendens]